METPVASCSICFFGLGEDPKGQVIVGGHVGTKCGHIFHQVCWDELIKHKGGVDHILCPKCRGMNLYDDVKKVHLDFNDGAVEFGEKLERVCEELEKLKVQLHEEQKKNASLEVGKDGSRVHRNRRFEDSRCFNCESALHETRDCALNCFIRNRDSTGYEKFEKIEKYSFQMKLPGRPAGKVVSFYEDTLRKKLSREGVQLAFSFYFFDDGCWNCANPFHHRPECKDPDNVDLHTVARRMHEINHPPSPGELLKRYERRVRYTT